MKTKLQQTGETIFTVMSVLATQHKAINLGQGFPDFQMDEALTDLVNKVMKDGHNQYTHMNGYPPLRERIASKVYGLYGKTIDGNNNITVTPGGTYAIFNALTAIIHPGDEVIYFEPAYDSYVPGILINGGKPVPVKMIYPDFKIDWEMVKKNITGKTKAIIINTPHNPTGTVLDEDDIAALREIVSGTDIIIISDEVYEHIIFDNKPHLSMLRYDDLFDRSYVCFSFGKVYHCTGWKLGYVVAPEKLTKEFRSVHQFNCFTCNTPMQVALSEYIENGNAYQTLGGYLQKKRDYFMELMFETKFTALNSSGSYFQLYDYSELSDEDELEFAKRLTREAGVTGIPVSAFYSDNTNNKLLRFCFVKKEETLYDAVERLKKFS